MLANAPPPVLTMLVNQMPGLPVYPINIPKLSVSILINITISAHKNCIKQVTKLVPPTEKRHSKLFYCFYGSFMVNECSSYSKMKVLDCLKSLTLSAVGNDDRMLRNKFFVVCKCPAAETLCASNARGLSGGMLAAGIDSYICRRLRLRCMC